MQMRIIWAITVFIINLVRIVIRFINLSRKQIEIANYEKIWKYYNFANNSYEDEKTPKTKQFFKIIWIQFIIYPLLSWLWLILIIYFYVSVKIEEKNLQKEIKEKINEIKFKLKYNQLSKREVKNLLHWLRKALWEDFEENYITDRWEDRYEDISLWKDWICLVYHALYVYGWTKHVKYQYKIENTKVSARVTDEWNNWIMGPDPLLELADPEKAKETKKEYEDVEEWFIKDWIVTDAEIRFWETMEERRKSTERWPLYNSMWIAYILYNDENLSDKDFKNYIRDNINNIKSCRDEIKEIFYQNEVMFRKSVSEDWHFYTEYKDDMRKDEKRMEKYYKKIEDITKKYNCLSWEFVNLTKKWKVITKNEKWETIDDTGISIFICSPHCWNAFEPRIISFYEWLLKEV